MEKELRMWGKTFLIMAGLFLLCFLMGKRTPERDYEKEARIREYEKDSTVEQTEVTLLAYGDLLQAEDDKMSEEPEEENRLKVLTTEGIYTYETKDVEEALYRQVTAYVRGEEILDIVPYENQQETVLFNVWIREVEENRILCFLQGNSFYVPVETDTSNREQVADIRLYDGNIKDCSFKAEKISGKLLGVSEGEIELPKQTLKIDENVKVYRLYGKLEELTMQDLPVGYTNTDFVVEDGKVCACLLSSEESMETIRVLIQAGNYGGKYHESVTVSADCPFALQYGEEMEQYEAGEEIIVSPEAECYQKTERIYLTTQVNTGKMRINSIQRSREQTDYRGTLEIIKTEQGLAVINEILLEEYLYSVVPSEMPASYPMESLKAQAICARTYAYGNMEKAGFPELGAHVDDSTAFQVYGNIEERAETTEAVKETKGQVLTYEGIPIHAYYYSTSCGYGADLRAWNGVDADTLPYLQAKPIASAEITASDLEAEKGIQEEAAFQEFIKNKQPDFAESDEAWFRWKYEVEKIDVKEMEQRISDRYAVQPGFILTEKGNDYISQQPKEIGELKTLTVINRNSGGNAAELLVEGTKGTYLIQTEYNIRYVLNNGNHPVVRMDGTEAASPTLLPSAFIVIEAELKDERIEGYTIYGGGYGHGIGMSQNGAKNMALAGRTSEEILDFFYEESEMELIY